MTSRSRHALIATFADENALRKASLRLRDRGLRIEDAYAPYPLHGFDELIGVRRSRLPVVAFVAATAGCGAALLMEFYLSVIDWPLNVGGKPANSFLAFIPIAFELTILCAGLATAAAFLARSRLVPGLPVRDAIDGTTDDVFALVVRLRGSVDAGELPALLTQSGAIRVAMREVRR
jgi:ActD protein